MNAKTRKHNAMALINKPAFPKLNRDGRSGSPISRFRKMHVIGKIYELIVPTCPIEMMMLKAIDEPMIMRLSNEVMISVKITALSGISQPTGT